MQLKIKRLTDTAVLPVKAHETDAGFDIYTDESIMIKSGQTVAVSTGLAMEIPAGYYGKLKCRSGYSLKSDLRVIEGTIDADYRGEVKVICEVKPYSFAVVNAEPANKRWGERLKVDSVCINQGDKIAQLIIQPVPAFEIEECDELSESMRGTNGFGSTGK